MTIGANGGDYFRMYIALCCIIVRMMTAESRVKKRKITRGLNLRSRAMALYRDVPFEDAELEVQVIEMRKIVLGEERLHTLTVMHKLDYALQS